VFEQHERLRDLLDALKSERERQGIRLSELSDRTGIDKANLSRLESDARVRPTLETLQRVAAALGKSVRLELVDAA